MPLLRVNKSSTPAGRGEYLPALHLEQSTAVHTMLYKMSKAYKMTHWDLKWFCFSQPFLQSPEGLHYFSSFMLSLLLSAGPVLLDQQIPELIPGSLNSNIYLFDQHVSLIRLFPGTVEMSLLFRFSSSEDVEKNSSFPLPLAFFFLHLSQVLFLLPP